MRTSSILIAYGLFLIVCGVLGWAASGFEERAKTAILSGGTSGLLMLTLGLFQQRRRMESLRPAGALFAGLYGGVFSWRSIVAWGDVSAGEPKAMVATLLTLMAIASFGTVILLLRSREAFETP